MGKEKEEERWFFPFPVRIFFSHVLCTGIWYSPLKVHLWKYISYTLSFSSLYLPTQRIHMFRYITRKRTFPWTALEKFSLYLCTYIHNNIYILTHMRTHSYNISYVCMCIYMCLKLNSSSDCRVNPEVFKRSLDESVISQGCDIPWRDLTYISANLKACKDFVSVTFLVESYGNH
jgi:hypothetical protein